MLRAVERKIDPPIPPPRSVGLSDAVSPSSVAASILLAADGWVRGTGSPGRSVQVGAGLRAGRLDAKVGNAISILGNTLLQAMGIVSTSSLSGPEAIRPEGEFAFQVYEAKWLREKKARWAAELEKKHARSFSLALKPESVGEA